MIWIIYQILNQGNGDIIAINQDVLGKWIGGLFNFIFILYCIVRCNNTTYLYRSSTCLDVSFHFILDYSRGFLGLCYYIVTGGFRVVANWLLWNCYPKHSNLHIFYPLQYADFQNLFPIAQHSFLEIMKGMKGNMFSFWI